MKPFRTLAKVATPDGSSLTLHEHDGEHFIKLDGRQLMSTTSTTSELLLAELACEPYTREAAPRVLIGGLGLGFTMRRALELLPKKAEVHVAELVPEVVAWNRGFLRGVNGALMDDRRVTILTEDVFVSLKRAEGAPYDAIMLDVDNGPTSFVQRANSRLYSSRGYALLTRALRPGGTVAFWSAVEERGFIPQLWAAGFAAEAHEARAHPRAKRAAHRIYVAQRRIAEEPAAPVKSRR